MSASLPGLPARYEVRRVLGQGSQKSVYLAQDTTLDRPVAIAAIRLDRVGRDAIDPLFEARTMARIGDLPHVVAIYDVLEGAEHLFIVSRFLPGGDLATHLKAAEGRVLPVRRAVEIGAQVALALANAHESGISHRDVKPGNVFLDARGQAFLGDFGIAMAGGADGRSASHGLAGTLAYMPPEQIWGRSAEPSCDLYALGCVLYELVCGTTPFIGRSPTEILQQHETAAPIPPRDINPSVPVALNDLLLKLLAKLPADRPASSREVHAALHGILRGGLTSAQDEPFARLSVDADRLLFGRDATPARVEPAFVGRTAERAAIGQVRADVWRGNSRLLVVSGDVGVGKTRLLRELRLDAEAEGGLALVGQGYEDVPLPYRPFVEALLPLAGRLSEVDEADAALLRRFLHLGSTIEFESRQWEETDPQRLFLALSRALETFARTRPLLLLIEDLHWIDRASLDLFEHIAFRLAQSEPASAQILLVGSHRPLEADDRTARALGRLELERFCETIVLGGLDENAVYELVTELGVEQPSSGLVRRILDATGGNPLFIREVVHHLEASGAIRVRGGSSVASLVGGELGIPPSVAGAISARVAKLGEDTRQLLSYGALLGHRFDLPLLAAVSDRDEDAVVDGLDEAVRGRLLVDEGQSYVFGHPIVRQVVLREPSKTRLQRLHLRIASRLEEVYATRLDRVIPRIAHHLVRAGSAARPSKVIDHARRAGFLALENFAWHEAAQLFEAALAAGQEGGVATKGELAELHYWAGFTYDKSDDRGPCLEHLDAAITGFREVGDRRGHATALNLKTRARITFGMVTFRDLEDVRPLEDALADLEPGDARLRARIMGTIALAYCTAQEPARATEIARSAIDLARTSGDDRLSAELNIDLAIAQFQRLELSEALASWESGLAHARRGNDLSSAVACIQRMPMVLFMLGRLDDAERMFEESRELNRTVQSHGDESLGCAIRASLAVMRGDFETADRYAEEALNLQRRTHYSWAGIMADVSRAASRAFRGDWHAATAAIDDIFVPGRIFAEPQGLEPIFWPNRRIIDAYAGIPVTLTDDPPGFVPPPATAEAFNSWMVAAYCYQIELADFAGRPEFSARAEPVIEMVERSGVVLSFGWPFLLARIRGIAARLAGRREEARSHFLRAIRVAEGLRAGPEIGRSRLELARLLLSEGDASDRDAAADLLEDAMVPFRELGMSWFLGQARELAAGAGLRLLS